MAIYQLTGSDLKAFLDALEGYRWAEEKVDSIRIEPRKDGVALKINAGMWSPTIGRREV